MKKVAREYTAADIMTKNVICVTKDADLRDLSARVYGVGLSFQQHAPGALAIAKRLKELHPDALVVMGGLTASRAHTSCAMYCEWHL